MYSKRYLYAYPSYKHFKRVVLKVQSKQNSEWVDLTPVFVQYYIDDLLRSW